MRALRSTPGMRIRIIVGLVTCSLATAAVAGTAGAAKATDKIGVAATGALTEAATKNPKCDPSYRPVQVPVLRRAAVREGVEGR